MPHALRAALLVCLCVPSAAAATTTFGFSGTILTFFDTHDFLDASVGPGTSVAGTYDVDPTSLDGSSPFGVGLAQLTFQLGNYLFTASQSSHTIALINDHEVNPQPPPVVTDDIWQPAEFEASDLTPASNSSGNFENFGGYFALIQFFDFDSTAFDGSESEPLVPDDFTAPDFIAPWEQARLTLNSVDDSLVYDNRVKVEVDITSWSEVPNPRSAALLALGLATLAHQRHRARGR